MPSSPFLHLSAHLVVADLAKSITFNPVKRRSVEASQNADQAQRYILEKGTKVSEIVLPPRGMSGRLNMIMDSTSGKAQFPFMMVRAGDELFRIQRKDQLSVGQRALLKIAKKHSELHESIVKPHAAGVVVGLKRKAFESFDESKMVRKDVKIEVFFNGELADCVLVPERDGFESDDLKILFTGRRTERQVERPWVVVPHVQEPDGTIKEFTKSKAKAISPQEQWDQVAQALLSEAISRRHGTSSNQPSSSSYLEAVARLEMPEELSELCKLGNRKMGLIDVVVTIGAGKKAGPETRYLCEPERMIHTKRETISPIDLIEPRAKRVRLSSNQVDAHSAVGSLRQETISNICTPEPLTAARPKGVDRQTVVTGRTRLRPNVRPNNLKISPTTLPSPQTPKSVTESPTKKIPSSSPMQIMPRSILQSPGAMASFDVSSNASTYSPNPFVTAPSLPPASSMAVTTPLSSFSTGSSSIQTSYNEEPVTSSTYPTEERTQRKRRADALSPIPFPTSRSENPWPPIWPTPALSQDCVITYAEVGSETISGDAELNPFQTGKTAVFRQIKSTRPGVFEEEDVQAGFRFVVL